MEAIVLAGGFGKRLRQVVPDVPKPMAPIGGRPFLEILLQSLARMGFRRVVLSLGYLADMIVAHFGEKYQGLSLVYEIERSPLGTGGAIRQALSQCSEDHVYVFNGDTYLDLETAEVEALWQAHHVPIIVGCNVLDASRYGRLHAVDGRVVGFHEKGIAGPGLINAGCYVLPINLLDAFARGVNFSLETDFLRSAVKTQRIDVFVTKGRFIDIGVPEDYERAQRELTGARDE